MASNDFRGRIERHPVASFFVLTYATSWLAWLPAVLGYTRVLVPAEHCRERGPEYGSQLSRRKLLVYEAQRLDEGNCMHDVAQQGQWPPRVVRGELQETHVEEQPPQGGPLARRQRPALPPEPGQSSALEGNAHHAVAGARLDEAALGAQQHVSRSGGLRRREPERYVAVFHVGDLEGGPRIAVPQVPQQRRLIYFLDDRVEGC
jgi:hypothetical protein